MSSCSCLRSSTVTSTGKTDMDLRSLRSEDRKKRYDTEDENDVYTDLAPVIKRSVKFRPFPASRIGTMTARRPLPPPTIQQENNSRDSEFHSQRMVIQIKSSILQKAESLMTSSLIPQVRKSQYKFLAEKDKFVKNFNRVPRLENINKEPWASRTISINLSCKGARSNRSIATINNSSELNPFSEGESNSWNLRKDTLPQDSPPANLKIDEKGGSRKLNLKSSKRLLLAFKDVKTINFKKFSHTGDLECNESSKNNRPISNISSILKKQQCNTNTNRMSEANPLFKSIERKSVQFSNFVAIYKYHDVANKET